MNISFPKRNQAKLQQESQMNDDHKHFAPPAQRPQRQFAEEAAKAAQHVIDLENHVSTLEQLNAANKSHISVLEESNTILQEEISKLKRDNDRLATENTVIHTRLRTAADILLNIMKPLQREELDQVKQDQIAHAVKDLDLEEKPQ